MAPKRAHSNIDEIFARPGTIQRALGEAVLGALREHRRAGRPIVIWRDGHIVELRGEEIDQELERTAANSAGVERTSEI